VQLKIVIAQVKQVFEQDIQAEFTKNKLVLQDKQVVDELHVKQLLMQGKHIALVKSL